MAIPAVVLVDGEHYPPVTQAAIATLEERGYRVVAALFLGGAEKTVAPPDLGVPMTVGEPEEKLAGVIAEYRPEVVLDLSDEPVVGYRRRMGLAAQALLAGVAYQGADFRLEPPPRPRLTDLPTVAVVGTGKRTGKTSVSIELARHWREERRPCIVTMGRGGPAEAVVLRAEDFEPGPTALTVMAARGLHAASDYVEDALFAGVDTVGTRRCGAGLAGATVTDNFSLGVEAAHTLHPDLLIYEGSGTALPPAFSDATVLVMMTDLDPEYLRGYLGPYRLELADVVVALETGAGLLGIRQAIAEVAAELPILAGRLAPEPSTTIEGRRVLLVTTARPEVGAVLRAGLEGQGARRVHTIHSLGDRRHLAADLEAAPEVETLLVEVKAAAVDVVLPWAEARGIEAGFLHNRVELEEGVEGLARLVEAKW
ncbi:MAG: 2,3-diphosphoglycerate synthetase [Acidimicrobiia bacterium]